MIDDNSSVNMTFLFHIGVLLVRRRFIRNRGKENREGSID